MYSIDTNFSSEEESSDYEHLQGMFGEEGLIVADRESEVDDELGELAEGFKLQSELVRRGGA